MASSRVLAKCLCLNVETGKEMSPYFNPQVMETQISVSYERKRPAGHPHAKMQYSGTDNPIVSIEFFLLTQDQGNHTFNREFLNFIHSFLYPMKAASSVITGSPPRLLFVWPNVLSMTTRITAINTRHVRFRAKDLAAVEQVVSCTLEESRDFRWTHEDQLNSGFIRDGVS